MKCKLTLQEKLRDLRDERKLKLSDISEATNISISTLQRMENDESNNVGYQELAIIAKFYGVSTDYLFGLTDNRILRNVEIADLRLPDKAIELLQSGTVNNRAIGEIIAHADFPDLMFAIEAYIDKKVMPQVGAMNVVYKTAERIIRENYNVTDNDEYMKMLQNAVVDEDDFLRFRVSEKFNALIKSLFDEHKKDALPAEQADIIKTMIGVTEDYKTEKKRVGAERARLNEFGKLLGLDYEKLTVEELVVLMKALDKSEVLIKAKKRVK